MNKKKVQIKLVRSLIGRVPKHIKIAKQLGLSRMNVTVEHQDTPAIRGMINVISYLVQVEGAA